MIDSRSAPKMLAVERSGSSKGPPASIARASGGSTARRCRIATLGFQPSAGVAMWPPRAGRVREGAPVDPSRLRVAAAARRSARQHERDRPVAETQLLRLAPHAQPAPVDLE